jgi:hypothetical protein
MTDRFKTPTKINSNLPRKGMMVSVDNLPEMGVDKIDNIDYGSAEKDNEICVHLAGNNEWAYWNNCTPI